MYKQFDRQTPIAYTITISLFGVFCWKFFAGNSFVIDAPAHVFLDSVFSNSRNVLVYKIISIFLHLFSLINIYSLFQNKDSSIQNSILAIFLLIVQSIFVLSFSCTISDFIVMFYLTLLGKQMQYANHLNITANHFFTVGLGFGVFLILTPALLIFILIMIFIINIFGKNGFRDLFAFLLGFAVPVCIWIANLHLMGDLIVLHNYKQSLTNFQTQLPSSTQTILLSIGIVHGLLAQSFIANFNISTRKNFSMYSIILFLLILFNSGLVFGSSKLFLPLLTVSSLFFMIFIKGIRNIKLKDFVILFGIIWAIFNTFIKGSFI
jgi:hypothetical protein